MSGEVLSIADYRSALYLDFEGEGQKRDKGKTLPLPHMAGLYRPKDTGRGGTYRCVFFKTNWKISSKVKTNISVEDFESCFVSILKEISETNKKLLFWSDHERKILQCWLSNETFQALEPFLVNIKPATDKYINKKRLKPQDRTLFESFKTLYPKRKPPESLEYGAAETCRKIDKACGKHSTWGQFSSKEKQYVRDLLIYNETDCKLSWLIAKKIGGYFKKS